jgi:hypothetical protein
VVAVKRHFGRHACQPFEFRYVVRAEDFDVGASLACELAQANLIREALLSVFLHHPLVEAEPRCATRVLDVHLSPIEVRVTGIE